MVVRKCNIPNDSPLFLSFTETFNHEEPPVYTLYFSENFDHAAPDPPTYTLDFIENFDHAEPEPPVYSFDFSEGFDS